MRIFNYLRVLLFSILFAGILMYEGINGILIALIGGPKTYVYHMKEALESFKNKILYVSHHINRLP
jgi:hypothetical protein